MSHDPCVLSRDYFDPKFLRMPRNQREAGIDHLEWEERLRPLRPLTYDIGLGVSALTSLLFVGMVFFN